MLSGRPETDSISQNMKVSPTMYLSLCEKNKAHNKQKTTIFYYSWVNTLFNLYIYGQRSSVRTITDRARRNLYFFSGHLGKWIFLCYVKCLFENWEESVGFGCKKTKINYFLEVYFPLRCQERKKVLLKL